MGMIASRLSIKGGIFVINHHIIIKISKNKKIVTVNNIKYKIFEIPIKIQ